jgi:L-alanine-DL-glutamate epimerase-like enolase superfamily enzyme
VDDRVERIEVSAYTVPTDGPDGEESDGTLTWDSTTMIVVEAHGAGAVGLGYTYGEPAVATLIDGKLAPVVTGAAVSSPAAVWQQMSAALRNAGRPGVGAMAIAAVDIALWDLKARLAGAPLATTLPAAHDAVPVYGSGGFTNYPLDRLTGQLAGWVEQGISRVKLKISRSPADDPARLRAVREAIGDEPELFTDSNGALTRGQGVHWAQRLHDEWDVRWFEEPVSSDDRDGLRQIRDASPGGIEITAGEYGFVLRDFADLLEAGAVDCLQADVTRCCGITGLLQVGGLAAAHQIDLSAHCAPGISAHAFCAVTRLRHLEYFHDHVRVESLLLDGTLTPQGGRLRPDLSRHGHGMTLKRVDAEKYRVYA